MADRGRCLVQFGARCSKAAGARCRFKGTQGGKGWQVAHPAFKEQVQHPLRVNGEGQYLPLPLTDKKGVAKWNTAISPKQNDTSWGR